MTNEELNEKFEQYGKRYPHKTCVFHTELQTIKNLPFYLKKIVSVYIDEAETNPEIDHINSLRVESQGKNGHAIYYTYTPKGNAI